MAIGYLQYSPSYVHFMDVQELLGNKNSMRIYPARMFLSRQIEMTEYLEQQIGPSGLDWRWTSPRHNYRFKDFSVYGGVYIYNSEDRLAFKLRYGV